MIFIALEIHWNAYFLLIAFPCEHKCDINVCLVFVHTELLILECAFWLGKYYIGSGRLLKNGPSVCFKLKYDKRSGHTAVLREMLAVSLVFRLK
jgi:hypothetical protein